MSEDVLMSVWEAKLYVVTGDLIDVVESGHSGSELTRWSFPHVGRMGCMHRGADLECVCECRLAHILEQCRARLRHVLW